MSQVVLLSGVLLTLYGVAVLAGGSVAATRPLRTHSRTYGLVSTALGCALLVAGVGLLVAG